MFVCLLEDYIGRSYVKFCKCVNDCSITLTSLIDFQLGHIHQKKPLEVMWSDRITVLLGQASWDVQTIF